MSEFKCEKYEGTPESGQSAGGGVCGCCDEEQPVTCPDDEKKETADSSLTSDEPGNATAGNEQNPDEDKTDDAVYSQQCLEKCAECSVADEKTALKAKLKREIIFNVVTTVACVCLAFILILNTVVIPAQKYKKVMEKIDSVYYTDSFYLMKEIGVSDKIAAGIYDRAMSLIDSGNRCFAYALLNAISYKDSEEKLAEIEPYCYKVIFPKANIGSTVLFGSYEQDNDTSNGKEPIEWQVLARETDKILIVSKYVLDYGMYNTYDESAVWETSSLREWLNSTFLDEAFDSEARSIIQNSLVHNPSDFNSTFDKIFLLDPSEVDRYFLDDKDRKCIPTEYAVEQGACPVYSNTEDDEGSCEYFLRSSESMEYSFCYVNSDGDTDLDCLNRNCNKGIRPALWIDLGRYIF